MGLSKSSALCFVIDTTGSMSDDIAEAKRVSFEIIDRKRGTQQEPSLYILVPFNDPGKTFRPSRQSSIMRRIQVEICCDKNNKSQDDCVSLNASCLKLLPTQILDL